MKLYSHKLLCLAATGMVSLAIMPDTQAAHIDVFSDGDFSLSGMGGDTLTSTQTGAAANIFMVEREVTFAIDLGETTVSVPGAGPGILGVSADNVDALSTLSLVYNGVGSAGFGGVDFATDWNLIRVDMTSITGGALDMRLTVTDSNGNSGVASLGALTAGGQYDFAFNDPSYTNFGVDFTTVDSVELHIETIDPGVAYSLNGFARAVPEPSTGLLMVIACSGLIIRRRRK